MDMTNQTEFKSCPMCRQSWRTREQFLTDPTLHFNGYQASFEVMDEGLFYFTHDKEGCGSTMIVEAVQFYSLFPGKRYGEIKLHDADCPGYCNDRNRLERCAVHCQQAFVREISQILLDQNRKIREKTDKN